MSHILAPTREEKEQLDFLISRKIPKYRQAYSDKTAFIMACLSELVYIKYNKPFFDKGDKHLIHQIKKLIDDEKLDSFKKLYDIFSYDYKQEMQALIEQLSVLNITLEKTFDCNGTQAMIISTNDFYTLVFRGTQTDSIKDLKSDLRANLVPCSTGGKVHDGFNRAFLNVYDEIQHYFDDLKQDDNRPLFITGHSLGGALATIATKKLFFANGIAACYTFGSPRVGDEQWVEGMKTPIYRIVNSADPVTMLPPGDDAISLVAFLLRLARLEELSKKLRTHFGGYYHMGYMRFLTNTGHKDYEKVKLLYSVSLMRRFRAYFVNKLSFKSIPSDHSIRVYREKLKYIALLKNKNH
jgi:hypothetical protein